MQTVTSKDNPKLKAVRALVRSKKARQEASAFVVEGVRSLSALADGSGMTGCRLKEIWVSSAASVPDGLFTAPVYKVADDVMEQLSDCRTSQGILGVVDYSAAPPEIHPERGLYLLLDGVSDPGNLGTLIRSAVAFGCDGVFLHGDTVEMFNPKTVRAAMGALPFCRHGPADGGVFRQFEQHGYQLLATVVTDGESLYEAGVGPKTVLMIGSEAHGISGEMLRRATRKISIPMSGNVESLNAAVAGSICMAELSRRSQRSPA